MVTDFCHAWNNDVVCDLVYFARSTGSRSRWDVYPCIQLSNLSYYPFTTSPTAYSGASTEFSQSVIEAIGESTKENSMEGRWARKICRRRKYKTKSPFVCRPSVYTRLNDLIPSTVIRPHYA